MLFSGDLANKLKRFYISKPYFHETEQWIEQGNTEKLINSLDRIIELGRGSEKQSARTLKTAIENEMKAVSESLVAARSSFRSLVEQTLFEELDSDQIEQLKQEYAKLPILNISSPLYPRLQKMLDSLGEPELQQLVNAKIKWVSVQAQKALERKEAHV